MRFITLEVKVFPSAKLGGWTQFLSFLCRSTSLQFFWLSWPLKPFSPLIIICIYTALLISNSFISIISFDSHHHSVKQVGRVGNIIRIWLGKKMTYWNVKCNKSDIASKANCWNQETSILIYIRKCLYRFSFSNFRATGDSKDHINTSPSFYWLRKEYQREDLSKNDL